MSYGIHIANGLLDIVKPTKQFNKSTKTNSTRFSGNVQYTTLDTKAREEVEDYIWLRYQEELRMNGGYVHQSNFAEALARTPEVPYGRSKIMDLLKIRRESRTEFWSEISEDERLRREYQVWKKFDEARNQTAQLTIEQFIDFARREKLLNYDRESIRSILLTYLAKLNRNTQ